MASKKSFVNKLGSNKSKKASRTKLSDADIEKAFEEAQDTASGKGESEPSSESEPKVVLGEPETERLYLRVPKHLHDRLKRVSRELGVTKSAIVKQGITAELNRLEK